MKITVTLDAEDCLIVGGMLRMFGRVDKSPDPLVGERLQRVGEALGEAWVAAQRAPRGVTS